MKKNKIINIILIILIALCMTSCVDKTMQNDTFFTIALGERTVQYGLEEYDQLVWHENLEFIHLRWLFDVLIYGLYSIFGFTGIYVFVIVISIAQGLLYYFILNKITNNRILSFLATLITMYFNSHELTARGQIISFTLFLIEFYCIEELMKTNKKRYIVLLLTIPILIVNFHASVLPMYFVFFLPYIAEFIFAKINLKKSDDSKIIIEKRNITSICIIMGIALILGFCSPIGIDAYKYMFKVMGGISTEIISELQQVGLIQNTYYSALICLAIALICFTKVKIKITDGLYILGFLLLSLPTYRCIYFFYLFASICIFRILNDFIKEYNFNFEFINLRFKKILTTLSLLIVILFSVSTILDKLNDQYIDTTMIPVNATNYILSNIDLENMRLYNHFNCGSYLEMKGIKTFIDSRSEMYTEEFNQGVTILDDWFAADSGEVHYSEIFDKYKITHALVEKNEIISIFIKDNPNWKLIYQDDSFEIYEQNNVK